MRHEHKARGSKSYIFILGCIALSGGISTLGSPPMRGNIQASPWFRLSGGTVLVPTPLSPGQSLPIHAVFTARGGHHTANDFLARTF